MYCYSTILITANSKWATMNKQIIKEWLKTTKIPLTVISRELNISRNTLYTWMKPESDMRSNNVEKILEVYGNDIKNTQKEYEMGFSDLHQEEDLSYAGLLKDKINALTKENEMLQNMLQHNPWSDTVYEQTQPDFTTNVLITYENSVLRRMITDVKGINESKKLTESQKQRYSSLISVNEWFRMNDHPINDIIEKESLKSVQGYTRWLLPIVNAMKIMVGGGISLPIWYDFNKGLENKKQDIVKTQCYMKIHWWENPKRIETKNVIM